MNAATDILNRLMALGACVKRNGDHVVLSAGQRPVPGELLEQARAAKPELLHLLIATEAPSPTIIKATPSFPPHPWFTAEAALATLAADTGTTTEQLAQRDWPASAWRRLFAARVAFWSASRSDAYGNVTRHVDGHRLAWSDLQNRWHKRHGERPVAGACAGCGEPIGSAETLTLYGYQTHLGRDPDCLTIHGSKWRAAADAGLKALGVMPPESSETSAHAAAEPSLPTSTLVTPNQARGE